MFLTRFCPSFQSDIILVLKPNGSISKFAFDTKKSHFVPVHCSDCRLEATEAELRPLYAVWAENLGRYVIFARNSMSNSIQQFIYAEAERRFEQIDDPRLEFDENCIKSTKSELLFSVGSRDENGVTVIRKDSRGRFRKEKYNEKIGKFEILPPKPVKYLKIFRKEENDGKFGRNRTEISEKDTQLIRKLAKKMGNPEKIYEHPVMF